MTGLDWDAIYSARQLSLAKSKYNPQDKEAITNFLTSLEAQNVGRLRLSKYVGIFMQLERLINKPLVAFESTDIDSLCATINKSKWAGWTKRDYTLTLRKFYRFVDNNDTRAGRIKVTRPAPKMVDERDVLSEADIVKLEQASGNIRERTIARFLFETAARGGEFCSLKVGDVQERPPFLVFHIKGTKNAFANRTVPVNNPDAIELFKEYMASHPTPNDPQAPLWVTYFHNKPLDHPNLNKILRKLAKDAGISKAINPHFFRHSKISQLSTLLSEQMIKNYVGWSKSSEMMAVYDHSGLNSLMSALEKTKPQTRQEQLEAFINDVLETLDQDRDTARLVVKKMVEQGRASVLTQKWGAELPVVSLGWGANNQLSAPLPLPPASSTPKTRSPPPVTKTKRRAGP